jgi:hypothetical protein
MVMTEDVVFAPASNQDSTIVPEGRWRLELQRIEAAPPSTFSDDTSPRAKWVFHLYAEMVENMEKGEQFYFNGEPYELFRHTSLKNSPRAYARKYAEALLGRALTEGEIPSKASLLGKSMSAVISYDAGTIDPNTQVLNLSSLRPVAMAPKAAAPAPARPASPQVSADASDDDIDRALLVSKIQKSLKRLKALDEEAGASAQAAVDASDMNEALLDDLHLLSNQISAAVQTALED